MERFGNLLRWCIDHWKSGGISTIVAGGITAITWFLAHRKEWKQARRAKADSAVDFRVIQILQNRKLWVSPRGMTGAGDPLVRSAELAEALSLNPDAVNDSLERLKAQGKVRSADGTLDNPAPYWHILRR
jgi:hypothetical protein